MSLHRPDRLLQETVAQPKASPGQDHRRAAALRRVERQRRVAQRARRLVLPTEALGRITHSSFRLENLSITERDVGEALARGAGRRALRPPQLLRIRNHVAILRHIQKIARHGEPLKLPVVVRWYTSFSCGLSMGVDLARVDRIEHYLRRINSPQLRIQHAIADVAQVHVQLTSDPIFPGFNGILARLLLQYHLARCGLPLVMFVNGQSGRTSFEEALLEMVSAAYELLLRECR
jgi:hypothetical protein